MNQIEKGDVEGKPTPSTQIGADMPSSPRAYVESMSSRDGGGGISKGHHALVDAKRTIWIARAKTLDPHPQRKCTGIALAR